MKIKVLLVIPNKEVQIVKIPANLKFIKSFIGESLYRVKLNEDTILIANNDAQMDEFNRILGKKIVLGTFLIVGIKNKHRVSLKKRQIRKFTNMFALKKHQKKIGRYKDQYLEDFYCRQREIKQKNAEEHSKEFLNAA